MIVSGGHRDTFAGETEREVGDAIAVLRDVQLRTEMESALDSRFDYFGGAVKRH